MHSVHSARTRSVQTLTLTINPKALMLSVQAAEHSADGTTRPKELHTMQVTHANGNIVITVPVSKQALDAAAPSSSGKTLLVDTGNHKVVVEGKTVTVQCSAYIPNPAFKAEPKAKSVKAA